MNVDEFTDPNMMDGEQMDLGGDEEPGWAEEPEIGVETDVTKDGGVLKTILVKGDGWDHPEKGDEVTVHYVGTLTDGTPFDSSRERGEPFRFNLGTGSVIKGWDQGVITMKKGEKAKFVLRADYAYGASGSPPKIGPNATLVFEVELLSWVSNKDLTEAKDGGIIKTVVVEGLGWETPKRRDEVTVRVKASVEGAAAPFLDEETVHVDLHKGYLCPGFGTVVQSMKKGEVATVKVRSDYAFRSGSFPAPPGVPSESDLSLEVELKNLLKVDNVVPEADGAVLIKHLVDGEGWERPNDLSVVHCSITGRLEDGTVFDDRSDASIRIDEDDVPDGVDKALGKMKKGAKAFIYINDPAFGFGAQPHEAGGKTIPGGSKLVYEVELKGFENSKEVWDLDVEGKVECARTMKDAGNAVFKAGKLRRALRRYERGLRCVDNENEKWEGHEGEVKELRRTLRLNMAATQLKLKNPSDADKLCSKVLDKETTNVKALFRRAQARVELNLLDDAERDLKRALETEPGNVDVANELKRVKRLVAEQNKKEKGMYSKMFARPAAKAPAAAAQPAEPAAAAAQ